MKKLFFIPICALLLTSCVNFSKKTVNSLRGTFIKKHKKKGGDEGLKEALKLGVYKATQELSAYGGYGGRPEHRIFIPEALFEVTASLEKEGIHEALNDFEEKMNKVAELASEDVAFYFADAIRELNFDDSQLNPGESVSSITEYLRKVKFKELHRDYLPHIRDKMGDVGLFDDYKKLITQYLAQADSRPHNFSLEDYVTDRALDKIFFVMEDSERQLRSSPESRTTALLRETFSGDEPGGYVLGRK